LIDRHVGAVRADAAVPFSAAVAVVAEHLKPGREAATTQPLGQGALDDVRPVLSPIAVDVVERQKERVSFVTARAAWRASSVVLQRGIARSVAQAFLRLPIVLLVLWSRSPLAHLLAGFDPDRFPVLLAPRGNADSVARKTVGTKATGLFGVFHHVSLRLPDPTSGTERTDRRGVNHGW
jgi:hypothetical protein